MKLVTLAFVLAIGAMAKGEIRGVYANEDNFHKQAEALMNESLNIFPKWHYGSTEIDNAIKRHSADPRDSIFHVLVDGKIQDSSLDWKLLEDMFRVMNFNLFVRHGISRELANPDFMIRSHGQKVNTLGLYAENRLVKIKNRSNIFGYFSFLGQDSVYTPSPKIRNFIEKFNKEVLPEEFVLQNYFLSRNCAMQRAEKNFKILAIYVFVSRSATKKSAASCLLTSVYAYFGFSNVKEMYESSQLLSRSNRQKIKGLFGPSRFFNTLKILYDSRYMAGKSILPALPTGLRKKDF